MLEDVENMWYLINFCSDNGLIEEVRSSRLFGDHSISEMAEQIRLLKNAFGKTF